MTSQNPNMSVDQVARALSEPMSDGLDALAFGFLPQRENTLQALTRRGLVARVSLTPLGFRVWAYIQAQGDTPLRSDDLTEAALEALSTKPSALYLVAARMRRYSWAGHGRALLAEGRALSLESRADALVSPGPVQDAPAHAPAPDQVSDQPADQEADQVLSTFTPSLVGRTGTTRHGERIRATGPAKDPARVSVVPQGATPSVVETFTPRVADVSWDRDEYQGVEMIDLSPGPYPQGLGMIATTTDLQAAETRALEAGGIIGRRFTSTLSGHPVVEYVILVRDQAQDQGDDQAQEETSSLETGMRVRHTFYGDRGTLWHLGADGSGSARVTWDQPSCASATQSRQFGTLAADLEDISGLEDQGQEEESPADARTRALTDADLLGLIGQWRALQDEAGAEEALSALEREARTRGLVLGPDDQVSPSALSRAQALGRTPRGNALKASALRGSTDHARAIMSSMAREILGLDSDPTDAQTDALADAFWGSTGPWADCATDCAQGPPEIGRVVVGVEHTSGRPVVGEVSRLIGGGMYVRTQDVPGSTFTQGHPVYLDWSQPFGMLPTGPAIDPRHTRACPVREHFADLLTIIRHQCAQGVEPATRGEIGALIEYGPGGDQEADACTCGVVAQAQEMDRSLEEEAHADLSGQAQAPEPTTDQVNAETFATYLRGTLIPDLRESGLDSTADDFATCIALLEEASSKPAQAPHQLPTPGRGSDGQGVALDDLGHIEDWAIARAQGLPLEPYPDPTPVQVHRQALSACRTIRAYLEACPLAARDDLSQDLRTESRAVHIFG